MRDTDPLPACSSAGWSYELFPWADNQATKRDHQALHSRVVEPCRLTFQPTVPLLFLLFPPLCARGTKKNPCQRATISRSPSLSSVASLFLFLPPTHTPYRTSMPIPIPPPAAGASPRLAVHLCQDSSRRNLRTVLSYPRYIPCAERERRKQSPLEVRGLRIGIAVAEAVSNP